MRGCREWFQKFKNCEFDIEDKEHSGRPKVYEVAELEALLDQDTCQTQEQFGNTRCHLIHKHTLFIFTSLSTQ